MASDSWTSRLSSFVSSRRYQSRSDLFFAGNEEIDGDDESRTDFLCPFCAEDFDFVGLCCHIDEDHPVEVKNGVCPVCAKRVGMDLVGHITMQHGSFFKMQRKKRFRKGGSNSALALLKKELREGNLQAILGGSSYGISSSNTDPDPLLSSFIFSPSLAEEPESVEPFLSTEASFEKEVSEEEIFHRKVESAPPLSGKDQAEKVRKCEFVEGLLLSTMLDDIL